MTPAEIPAGSPWSTTGLRAARGSAKIEDLQAAGWKVGGRKSRCWLCGWVISPEQWSKGNRDVRSSGWHSANGGLWCGECVRDHPALGETYLLWQDPERESAEAIELGWSVWQEWTRREADTQWMIKRRAKDAGHDPMFFGVVREVQDRIGSDGQISLFA